VNQHAIFVRIFNKKIWLTNSLSMISILQNCLFNKKLKTYIQPKLWIIAQVLQKFPICTSLLYNKIWFTFLVYDLNPTKLFFQQESNDLNTTRTMNHCSNFAEISICIVHGSLNLQTWIPMNNFEMLWNNVHPSTSNLYWSLYLPLGRRALRSFDVISYNLQWFVVIESQHSSTCSPHSRNPGVRCL